VLVQRAHVAQLRVVEVVLEVGDEAARVQRVGGDAPSAAQEPVPPEHADASRKDGTTLGVVVLRLRTTPDLGVAHA
jgi:hypothetical protein